MCARAILTAFSTASAPELNSAERFSWSPGVSRSRASHTSTYSAYGVTMKQVWVKRATCSCTRATTDVRRVADAGDRDAGAEVDQRVAVDVDEHAAARSIDEDRQGRADAPGHDRGPAGHQGLGLGTGNGGDEVAALGDQRTAGD